MTRPAHLRRLILMYVTMSLSLYNVYSSLLYFTLHSPFSFVRPKMTLRIFLSKTLKIVSSDGCDPVDLNSLFVRHLCKRRILTNFLCLSPSVVAFRSLYVCSAAVFLFPCRSPCCTTDNVARSGAKESVLKTENKL
jgi:hypothetical protein